MHWFRILLAVAAAALVITGSVVLQRADGLFEDKEVEADGEWRRFSYGTEGWVLQAGDLGGLRRNLGSPRTYEERLEGGSRTLGPGTQGFKRMRALRDTGIAVKWALLGSIAAGCLALLLCRSRRGGPTLWVLLGAAAAFATTLVFGVRLVEAVTPQNGYRLVDSYVYTVSPSASLWLARGLWALATLLAAARFFSKIRTRANIPQPATPQDVSTKPVDPSANDEDAESARPVRRRITVSRVIVFLIVAVNASVVVGILGSWLVDSISGPGWSSLLPKSKLEEIDLDNWDIEAVMRQLRRVEGEATAAEVVDALGKPDDQYMRGSGWYDSGGELHLHWDEEGSRAVLVYEHGILRLQLVFTPRPGATPRSLRERGPKSVLEDLILKSVTSAGPSGNR